MAFRTFRPFSTRTHPCGLLACGEAFTVFDASNPSSTDPRHVDIKRGTSTNGVCSTDISYFASNTIVFDQTLFLRWPTSGAAGDPNAAFLLTFNTDLTTVPNPRLAWLVSGGLPAYILGTSIKCATYDQTPQPPDKLPAVLGILNQDVSATDKQIKIDTSTATVAIPTDAIDSLC